MNFFDINYCLNEDYIYIIFMIIFILGYIIVKILSNFDYSKVRISQCVLGENNNNNLNTLEDYLNKHRKEDEKFFYN